MRSRSVLSACALAVTCLGLGASLASLVDYLGPAPTFCAATGCATVRESAWAHPLGIPMPLFGVVYFAAMVALAFVRSERARALRVILALGGSAWAVALVAVQALVIGAWCKLCMVADSSAFALVLLILAGTRAIEPRAWRLALVVPAIAALPLAFAIAAPTAEAPGSAVALAPGAPAVPDVIAREQIAGAVTVVEFVDFECPFCRKLAPVLADAIGRAQRPVKVVRRMVPLPMHPHARDAALAWCCADAQGLGDAMADALFDAPADDLTPEGCEQLATRIGCDLDQYRRTLADPATAQRVSADLDEAKAAGARGLPTIFIGTERMTGANHTADDLLAAIDRAAH